MWIDENRMKTKGMGSRFADTLVPSGLVTIPAFTVCELTVASRNHLRVAEGKGVKVMGVKPAGFSLYSCLMDLDNLKPTLALARLSQTRAQETYKEIRKDVETREVPFWAPVSPMAVVDTGIETGVRLVNWGDPAIPQIDLPIDTLLRYTNCTRVEWAAALLDVTIAAGALKVMVFSNDYWIKGNETGFRAIPVIDVEVLLQNLNPVSIDDSNFNKEDRTVTVDSGHTVELDGKNHALQIQISVDASPVQAGDPPTCADFALTGPVTELLSAHHIAFNLIDRDTKAKVPKIWHGYFNASPCAMVLAAVGIGKRKRMVPME